MSESWRTEAGGEAGVAERRRLPRTKGRPWSGRVRSREPWRAERGNESSKETRGGGAWPGEEASHCYSYTARDEGCALAEPSLQSWRVD